MKKALIGLLSVAALLLVGCNKYSSDIDNLNTRVDALEEKCAEFNSNIQALTVIINALQKNDFISGISKIYSGGAVVGYNVNFVKSGTVSIYNGSDGSIPTVGTKKDTDNYYYWTVKYDGGTVEWLLDADGNKVLAVGVTPLFKVKSGMWYVSYDKGTTWNEAGPADGSTGDSIFQDVSVGSDYVTFTLADGSTFSIPTFSLYTALYSSVSVTNSNTNSISTLIKKVINTYVYVKGTSSIVVDGETVGTNIILSSGDTLNIYNWTGSNAPIIAPLIDSDDGKYYWSITYGDRNTKWLLDSNGDKISAANELIEAPIVDAILNEEDNKYYWAIICKSDTTFITDNLGDKIQAVGDSASTAVFKGVDNSNPEYLVITLYDDTKINLPKKYSLVLSSDLLTMPVSDTQTVDYTIYGCDKSVTIELLTQGGVTATVTSPDDDSGGGVITIATSSSFAGNGKVIMIVSAGSGSTKTVVKSITINKKED